MKVPQNLVEAVVLTVHTLALTVAQQITSKSCLATTTAPPNSRISLTNRKDQEMMYVNDFLPKTYPFKMPQCFNT